MKKERKNTQQRKKPTGRFQCNCKNKYNHRTALSRHITTEINKQLKSSPENQPSIHYEIKNKPHDKGEEEFMRKQDIKKVQELDRSLEEITARFAETIVNEYLASRIPNFKADSEKIDRKQLKIEATVAGQILKGPIKTPSLPNMKLTSEEYERLLREHRQAQIDQKVHTLIEKEKVQEIRGYLKNSQEFKEVKVGIQENQREIFMINNITKPFNPNFAAYLQFSLQLIHAQRKVLLGNQPLLDNINSTLSSIWKPTKIDRILTSYFTSWTNIVYSSSHSKALSEISLQID